MVIFSINRIKLKSWFFCIFLSLVLSACKEYPELNGNIPAHRLFINYLTYVEKILERDFLLRNSSNKESERDKTFYSAILKIKKRMTEINPDVMRLKYITKDLPEEDKTVFYREYNRKRVQIQMLTIQLKRDSHELFSKMYRDIVPADINEFEIDF